MTGHESQPESHSVTESVSSASPSPIIRVMASDHPPESDARRPGPPSHWLQASSEFVAASRRPAATVTVSHGGRGPAAAALAAHSGWQLAGSSSYYDHGHPPPSGRTRKMACRGEHYDFSQAAAAATADARPRTVWQAVSLSARARPPNPST